MFSSVIPSFLSSFNTWSFIFAASSLALIADSGSFPYIFRIITNRSGVVSLISVSVILISPCALLEFSDWFPGSGRSLSLASAVGDSNR